MKTLHLGPEELLVAAKIAVPADRVGRRGRPRHQRVEARIRAAVPIARVIYLEPDIYSPRRPRSGRRRPRHRPRPPPETAAAEG